MLEPDSRSVTARERAESAMSAIHQSLLSHKPELSLRQLLRMVVGFACEITGARYGALGVLTRDGSRLRDFVYLGVDDATARRIGQLPQGKGLLGAVIHEARTLRIPDMAADPRSAGMPPHHPPMKSFLGVPLRIGERIFGNFYLTDKRGAASFTEEDARNLEHFSAEASCAVALLEEMEEENRHVFRALVEHAPFGIAFFPAGEAEPFGNLAAESLLGRITSEDHPGRTHELCRPDGSPLSSMEAPRLRALEQGETSLNVEVQVVREGRPPVPVLMSASPVLSEDGAIAGAVVVYQDISILKELERLRVEFAAMVAHDMRTPVQSVLLQIDTLLRRASGEAAWVPVSTLQTMKRNGEHLTRLISDLLDASRLEAGQLPLDLQRLEAGGVIEALVVRLRPSLGDRELTVRAEGAAVVLADRVRFEQILTNLLENAARYSGEHAPIRLEVSSVRGGTLIEVQDQGPGIPEDELPHVFDRFFRGRAAKARRSGLGLGLYFTRRLVEAHGGTLTVRSGPRGSSFDLWLPGHSRLEEKDQPAPHP